MNCELIWKRRISIICLIFLNWACLKKTVTNIRLRHIQIDELPARTLVYTLRSVLFSQKCLLNDQYNYHFENWIYLFIYLLIKRPGLDFNFFLKKSLVQILEA
jgi:hypothetical protein